MVEALNLVIVVLLVLANGFFVASEFALVGVRKSRIETLAKAGNRKAKRLLPLINNLNAYISATQLGITLASLALGWIGEPAVAHLLEIPLRGRISDTLLHTIAFTIAFSIMTFLHIVLGELRPKRSRSNALKKLHSRSPCRWRSFTVSFAGPYSFSIGLAHEPCVCSVCTLRVVTRRSTLKKSCDN